MTDPNRADHVGRNDVTSGIAWRPKGRDVGRWVLLAASVFWGVALSSRLLGKKPEPNWMLDLHRFLGGLAVVFSASLCPSPARCT